MESPATASLRTLTPLPFPVIKEFSALSSPRGYSATRQFLDHREEGRGEHGGLSRPASGIGEGAEAFDQGGPHVVGEGVADGVRGGGAQPVQQGDRRPELVEQGGAALAPGEVRLDPGGTGGGQRALDVAAE